MSRLLTIRVCLLILLLAVSVALAQQTRATLKGQVADPTGAVIPGATVTLSDARGVARTVTTDQEGAYVFGDLPAGRYTLRTSSPGFSGYESAALNLASGSSQRLDVALKLALEKQEITVKGDVTGTVSTEPSNNAGALVIKGADLEALPDDPDELEADLQALAGPSAGPNGGQIFIDGFTGGRLPPKASIREIRINQNPFSAEYDRLGFGRIEILTKPGSDAFHGQTMFSFGDSIFNSRNPFAPNRAPFQERLYGGNLSGPLNKRASFFVDLERREIDDNAVINATILDTALNPAAFSRAVVTPNRRTSVSPRLDYQLNQNNTLVMRYMYTQIGQENAGVGNFSLPERAYSTGETEHSIQVTETAVLGPKAVNETRFQFRRTAMNQLGDNSKPTINVLDAFTGGGAQIGLSYNTQDRWELQNYTTLALGAHGVKVGARLRAASLSDISPQNFGGAFTFSGGWAPLLDSNNQVVLDAAEQPVLGPITSLERYRRTLLFQQQGLPAAQIRALGGGATQFSITGGNPRASVSQVDLGVFAQDDWRVRPDFTLSLGLRYETQSNIHDWRDLAPRIGFAWAPGTKGTRRGKTVLRGGFGVFYDRFNENLTLQAIRFNGVNQQQYIVSNPDFFPAVPTIETLDAEQLPETIRRVAADLRAPYTMQTAIGIERQLPFNTTIATTFTNSRAVHLLRSRNINAPLPATFTAGVADSGVQPYGPGNIFQYESSGLLNQNQWMTNVNSRVNRNVSIFAFYVYGRANSNTDGAGTFPSDSYDLSSEYGRSTLDVRHRFVLGGSLVSPFGFRISPFIMAHSGSPFNITSGRDLNGDALFTDRPAFATDLSKPGVVVTPFGAFDPNPAPGAVIIPRNYGEGPGFFTVNLRLSKTFGFGSSRSAAAAGSPPSLGGGERPPGGGRGPGRPGGPGGPGGMRMGGGGGMRGPFGDGTTEKRYNLTFSVSARNLLNNVNPGVPVGNLTSPFFGQSTSTASGFGPFASAAGNRRVDFQLRFSF